MTCQTPVVCPTVLTFLMFRSHELVSRPLRRSIALTNGCVPASEGRDTNSLAPRPPESARRTSGLRRFLHRNREAQSSKHIRRGLGTWLPIWGSQEVLKNLSTVVTATGEVLTQEEATVYVKEIGFFVMSFWRIRWQVRSLEDHWFNYIGPEVRNISSRMCSKIECNAVNL